MKRNYFSRVLAIVLVMVFALTGLVACQKTPAEESKAPVTESSAPVEESSSAEKEVVDLVMYTYMTKTDSWGSVMKELYEYLKEAAKVNLEIKAFEQGEYTQKMQAIISAGNEKVDIITGSGGQYPFAPGVDQGAFADITDAVERLGANLKAELPSYTFDALTVDGKLYGISALKDLANVMGLGWNTVMADHFGMTDEIESKEWNFYTEWDSIFRTWKEKFESDETYEQKGIGYKRIPGTFTFEVDENDQKIETEVTVFTGGTKQYGALPVLQGSATEAALYYAMDAFVDDYIGVEFTNFDTWAEEDAETVFNAYATPEFAATAKILCGWADDLILPEFGAEWDSGWDKRADGLVSWNTSSGRLSADPYYMCGALCQVKWVGGLNPSSFMASSRSYVRAAYSAVSSSCTNVDRAVEFLDFAIADETYNTILRLGQEGVHWNDAGNGRAELTQDSGKHYIWYGANFPGNLFACKLPTSQPDTLYTDMQTMNANADSYGAKLDFDFVSEDVATEIAAIAVEASLVDGIYNGQVKLADCDATLANILTRMENAGLQTIIDEIQYQLDEYLGK